MTRGIETPEIFKNTLTSSNYAGSVLLSSTATGSSIPVSRTWNNDIGWAKPRDPGYIPDVFIEKGAPVADALKKEEIDLRIVKVVIADVDKNIPVSSRVLYQGEEQVTELTDEELFFEVPIVELLKKHNELRSKTLHKADTAKAGKDVFLEPIRVRDLRMVVVEIADFSN